MKALVTGGAGFIGSHVVRQLVDGGHEVRVLHLPSDDLRNLQKLDIEQIPGDVTDPASVKKAIKGCDTVFHLAAIYAIWIKNPELMRKVNVEGTKIVLQAAADAGARCIHTSSLAVFAGQGTGSGNENSPFRLGSTGDVYSQTKYDSHKIAEDMAKSGHDITIVAPCGPIGPGDVGPTPTGKLLLSSVDQALPVVVDSIVNLIDVRDVAKGHLLAAHKGRSGQSYLLGHRNITFSDLAQMALDLLQLRRPILKVPYFMAATAATALEFIANNVTHKAPLFTSSTIKIAKLGLRVDAAKARNDLGLEPRPLEHSVRCPHLVCKK